MTVNVLVACDINHGIGNDGDLPWPKHSADMRWFKAHTVGTAVVMGRKTWESIGSKALPGRANIVISSQDLVGPHLTLRGDMGDILNQLKRDFPVISVIGGLEIYNQAIGYADYLYWTTFKESYQCDTHLTPGFEDEFPKIKWFNVVDGALFQIRGRCDVNSNTREDIY